MSIRRLILGERGFVGTLMLSIVVLPALRSGATPTDYLVDTWRFDDDLPRDGINSIAQGRDGYLWVSSRYGVARFDGVRFANLSSQIGYAFLGYHFANLSADRFGSVWIATPGGGVLEWGDGHLVSHVAPRNPVFGPVFVGLTNAQGRELAMTPDGRLIGWSNGVSQVLASLNRWGEPVPPSLCQDRRGDIWFVTYQHKLVRADGTNAEEMVYGSGEERRNWIALQADAAGQLWAGTHLGVGTWRGTNFQVIAPPIESFPVDDIIAIPNASRGRGSSSSSGAQGEPSRSWVIAVGRAWLLEGDRWMTNVVFEPGAGPYETSPHITDREGNLWFCGTKTGIARAGIDGSLMLLTEADGVPSGRPSSIYEDREGSIWIGIEHAGLARLRPRYFRPIGVREGGKAPLVWAVAQDSIGAIWLGTEKDGLHRWHEGKFTRFEFGNGGVAGNVYSLCMDRRGTLWAGTGDRGVFRYENGKFVPVWEFPRPGWNKRVYVIYEDHLERMWFGTGLGLFCWEHGTARACRGKGFEMGTARVMAEDAGGRLWVGLAEGAEPRLAWLEGDELVPLGVEEGLKGFGVFGLLAGTDGSMWIGTVGGGLWHWRNEVFTRYTTAEGLPDDRIYSIALDNSGNLWLGSPVGIFRVSKSSIAALDAGHTNRLDCLVFNRTDGLLTRECSGGAQPSICRARGERLLFAMSEGAVALSPGRVQVNTLPPPVVIEDVRVNGKPATGSGTLRLEPGRCVVELHYTATSLTAPSKVRFKYRLDGVDAEWRAADASRSAMYSLTSPGDYRFHVTACNNDGVWNESGAMVALVIPPYFWQTWSFRVTASAAILLTLGGAVRFIERRKDQRRLERFEMQHRVEKERARIARDIHDQLGASLTEIGLLSEFAQRDSAPAEQVKADVQKIAGEARSCTQALDEIVWAVNPRHDTLDGFVTYACAYAEEHLRLANIRCRLDAAFPMPNRPLPADLRHHLFLAFKEALNNVVKHARASEVEIRLFVEANRLNVLIHDDGCGFDQKAGSTRNGLANMKERLESIGGGFECESAPGRGTRVKLVMQLD